MSDNTNGKPSYLKEGVFLGILTLFCFSCSMFRCFFTEKYTFLFLNWNLFLAAIPWIMAKLCLKTPRLSSSKFFVGIILLFWLLFFPNAPYILTDLFHLRARPEIPIWFDLVLILSFAWTGLLFGFLSLRDIERILKKQHPNFWVTTTSICLLFISSFGIYLGRYLRWNSWDIISQPFEILSDIGNRLIAPFDYPSTWGMTLFLGLFLNILYFSMNALEWKARGKG